MGDHAKKALEFGKSAHPITNLVLPSPASGSDWTLEQPPGVLLVARCSRRRCRCNSSLDLGGGATPGAPPWFWHFPPLSVAKLPPLPPGTRSKLRKEGSEFTAEKALRKKSPSFPGEVHVVSAAFQDSNRVCVEGVSQTPPSARHSELPTRAVRRNGTRTGVLFVASRP